MMNYSTMPPYKDMSGHYESAKLMVDELQRRGYDIVVEVIGDCHVQATLYRSGYRVCRANAASEYDVVRAVYEKA